MSHTRGSAVRHIVTAVATTAAMLAVDAGTALAADGQPLCIAGPSRAVTSPSADGDCRRGETLTTLATQSDVAALQAKVGALEAENERLDARVDTLETENATLPTAVGTLQDKLSAVSFDATGLNGLPTLKISGANLQLVNGAGVTDTLNGLGNLFIGYDEHTGSQTGSHTLVLGTGHVFTSFGGLAGGQDNTLGEPYPAAFGRANTASGHASSVSGGYGNTASGFHSAIGGGQNSSATASYASVVGGYANLASWPWATVSSGKSNVASGYFSSVSGGGKNTAIGDYSSILGGQSRTVSNGYGTSP